MELPANTSPTTSKELEQLGEEQTLGEATNLGCPRVETPNAITAPVSSGQTTTSGKTAIPRTGQTAAIPTTIPGGPTPALTATTPGGTTTLSARTGKT
jgi:hypothetical protein